MLAKKSMERVLEPYACQETHGGTLKHRSANWSRCCSGFQWQNLLGAHFCVCLGLLKLLSNKLGLCHWGIDLQPSCACSHRYFTIFQNLERIVIFTFISISGFQLLFREVKYQYTSKIPIYQAITAFVYRSWRVWSVRKQRCDFLG